MAAHAKAAAEHRRLDGIARGLTSFVLITLLVIAALLVLLGILARPGKNGISRIDGRPVLTVLSGSMVPVFHPGDMIVDNPVTASQAGRLAPRDIITFHVPGSDTELITHRIVAVKHVASGVMYQTKGDANNAPDAEYVSPNQVVGTYKGRIRFAGYVLRAARNKIFFFFLIFVPVLYLVGSWIVKHWREPQVGEGHDELSSAVDATAVPAEHVPALVWAASAENPLPASAPNGRSQKGGAEQV